MFVRPFVPLSLVAVIPFRSKCSVNALLRPVVRTSSTHTSRLRAWICDYIVKAEHAVKQARLSIVMTTYYAFSNLLTRESLPWPALLFALAIPAGRFVLNKTLFQVLGPCSQVI